ncbi:hypothetical protein SPRG_19047 [Saprolegnia parasitica CBS 223.65]|uniref:BTB domain-containing protein n=1 Tax=Saprolegnia parasitica (strain CBS 223.65) TaxID=695850 RepID=A0A067CUQ4_SAPPC|nr:hypothetical protein SPRG_19047 [Saprolegnia parasitica CBS 223.65]KDO34208.1 hypothetical protein SPRG_19047 [Saprolegnia parasitica CBS 223.65]|eukprot:XP_012195245.1 hypothetical protein SPRG_19047 [Saprolegnia parasitica CBS 223.65]
MAIWAHPQGHAEGDTPGSRAAHTCEYVPSRDAFFLFGGWSGKMALNDLWQFHVPTQSWSLLHADGRLPSPRNNHASTVVDDKIFIHGGHDGSTWLSDLHVFDTQRCKWSVVTTSGHGPSARACHTMSRVGRKIYVFGGFDGVNCFNDIDILDLDTYTWIHPTVHGYQPAPRNAHTVSIRGTTLYMFGGHSGAKHLRDLYEFQTETLTWTHLASIQGPFPPGLRGHTATIRDHKIYFFGGYDGRGRSNELFILNLDGMCWERPPEMDAVPTGRQRHSACLVGARIYFVGGFDGFKWMDDMYILDIGSIEEQGLRATAQAHVVANLRHLLLDQDASYSDVTFLVQDKPIRAHKAIVAAQSPFFRCMFASGMRESHADTITIPNWSHAAFYSLLEFFYTGYVEQLSLETAVELLGLADHYSVAELSRLCENHLAHTLDVESVCTVLIAANMYEAMMLKASCMTFIHACFQDVVDTKGFEELGEYPMLLLEVTRSAKARRPLDTSSGYS